MPQTVIPQLRITNAPRSLKFYVDGLGFKIDWEHRFGPTYPLFVQLTREEQTIFLTEHANDCQVGGACYFIVPNAEQYYVALQARGVTASKPIEVTPWGTHEFIITDPDGNHLRFASEKSMGSDSIDF